MRLVIDTNRIIAALIRDSTSRRIILMSGIHFMTVSLSIKEIDKYKSEIMERRGLMRKSSLRLFHCYLRR